MQTMHLRLYSIKTRLLAGQQNESWQFLCFSDSACVETSMEWCLKTMTCEECRNVFYVARTFCNEEDMIQQGYGFCRGLSLFQVPASISNNCGDAVLADEVCRFCRFC